MEPMVVITKLIMMFFLQVEMRREKLVAMFGTPCHKWNSRRKFPFKLTLQLLKVLVVTLQVSKNLIIFPQYPITTPYHIAYVSGLILLANLINVYSSATYYVQKAK